MTLIGYTDRPGFDPGETVPLRISGEHGTARVALVRLRHGDTSPDGPGLLTAEVPTVDPVQIRVAPQPLRTGSHVRVPAVGGADLRAFTVWAYPTLVDGPGACLADLGASRLTLDADRRLCLETAGSGRVLAGPVVRLHRWQLLAVSVDPADGSVRLSRVNAEIGAAHADHTPSEPVRLVAGDAELLFAIAGDGGRPYTGKLEAPALWDGALSPADVDAIAAGGEPAPGPALAWDFAREIDTWRAVETHQGLHGALVNTPARAVTGRLWTGEEDDWRRAGSQYAAVHFHADDIGDAAWTTTAALDLPEDLPNGVYAAEVRGGDGERDWIPFVVRERPGRPRPALAVLLPTFTYLAYANEAVFEPHVPLLRDRRDDYVMRNGLLSAYNFHADGSGVAYASWHRPMTNLRPDYRYWLTGHPHGLPSDLYLLHWLEERGVDHVVITDHDLHDQGADLLAPFRTLVTGAHPEYWTSNGLTAVQTWLSGGGRLMYLGGNGFAGRVGVSASAPDVMELRRRLNGPGLWDAEPGELHMSTTGEAGGFLRNHRPRSREITGVEISGMGFADARPYRVLPAAKDPRAAWIFDGVAADVFGDRGLHMGGAAGYEVDRADFAAGTPEHALVVATSDDGFPGYEVMDPRGEKRSDMVFFETPSGGAVFSVGSITWTGALGPDPDVARITGNVLDRFADPAPFGRPAP